MIPVFIVLWLMFAGALSLLGVTFLSLVWWLWMAGFICLTLFGSRRYIHW